MSCALSPWDAVYCILLDELNRRHKLDVLMEKWKSGIAIARRDQEITDCHNRLITSAINEIFDLYYNAGEDEEDIIRGVAVAMQMHGPRFYFQNRFHWLNEDWHNDDMYYSAINLAARAYVLEVSPHDDSISLNDLP